MSAPPKRPNPALERARQEVSGALKALDAALIQNAPISMQFEGEPWNPAAPAVGAKLKKHSQLGAFHRETVSEVAEKFAAASPVETIAKLRFAKDDMEVRPMGVITPSTRLQLGATLTSDPATELPIDPKTGKPTYDAETRALIKKVAAGTDDFSRVATATLTATQTTKVAPRFRPDSAAATLAVGLTAPDFSSTTRTGHQWTPEMQEHVEKYDYAHALKADDERVYQDKLLLFDQLTGRRKKH